MIAALDVESSSMLSETCKSLLKCLNFQPLKNMFEYRDCGKQWTYSGTIRKYKVSKMYLYYY